MIKGSLEVVDTSWSFCLNICIHQLLCSVKTLVSLAYTVFKINPLDVLFWGFATFWVRTWFNSLMASTTDQSITHTAGKHVFTRKFTDKTKIWHVVLHAANLRLPIWHLYFLFFLHMKAPDFFERTRRMSNFTAEFAWWLFWMFKLLIVSMWSYLGAFWAETANFLLFCHWRVDNLLSLAWIEFAHSELSTLEIITIKEFYRKISLFFILILD